VNLALLQKLWFSLLDVVLQSQRDSTTSEHADVIKRLARHVLTSMIGHMALPTVLQKIIQVEQVLFGKDIQRFYKLV